jgi:MFS family permease
MCPGISFGVGVLSGLTPILLGFTTTLHVAMLAAAAVGASTSAFMTLSQGIIQMLAPDGIRGRVMSANTWHTQGAMGGFNAVSGRTAAAVASRPTPPISSSAGTWGCRDALRLFREIQIPPDFVVDGWASSVESHSTLDFLYVPDA